ncbi:hypothetical protein [Thermus altitudinis]|uniref:hypothetical protein n=1 Tax=Thermus altitudinis TaxID=2908145 RepID=UPI001FA96427|nr:hypothetical protein [Thermus altitudinis]
MKRPLNDPLYVLFLYGPAKLVSPQGTEVRLSRKGLVLLYYLALEGPTSRVRLADLLYRHGAGLQNLRVELFRLNQALGRKVFPGGQDPLALPSWIRLEVQGPGEALGGLEEVGDLEEWVVEVRARYQDAVSGYSRGELLSELASLRPPFLLVLRGRLGAGQRELARELARVLGLSFHEIFRPEGLVYLEPPYSQASLREALRSKAFLVVRLDPGEEPKFFLELRAHYPAERIRVVDLGPISWPEARKGPLAQIPFQEAARAYFGAGGQPEWMPEWLSCSALPQRPLAQLRLQMCYLSEAARLALERLSVTQGAIPEEVLDALGALPYIEELERKGWLVYRDGYRFASGVEQRLLYLSLPPGRRRELHERAATALMLAGKRQKEAWHRRALGERVPVPWAGGLEEAASQVPGGWYWRPEACDPGREQALLPGDREGVFLTEKGFGVTLLEPESEALLALAALEEELLLRILGEAYTPEEGFGLFLEVINAGQKAYLRLDRDLDYRLWVGPGPLRLRFWGQGVAEFALQAHRPRPGRGQAYRLAAE